MRLGPGLLALAILLVLTGCGGKAKGPSHPTAVGPIGSGPAGVWLFQPAGKPKSVVVFFHGQGGPTEATPVNHRPWIDHLVARGSIVIYPRYEMSFEADPMQYVVAGVRTATKRVDVSGLPVLALGYSRGGPMAVEYGAVATQSHLPVPAAIVSVFPADVGNQKHIVDLTPLPHSTRLELMVGHDDKVVGSAGAKYLLYRLQASGNPGTNIHVDVVRSHSGFAADHFAPLQDSPDARAAFWRPTDRLLDDLR